MSLFLRSTTSVVTALSACLFLAGCAMKVAPTGGPKDAEPAVLTVMTPPSGTTSMKERTITFEFDDYVDRSVRNAITILPNARFSTTYSGDELDITFEEPLDTNTTYTVTLGTEWSDLRGNKPSESYTMVFSTGDHIDSGSISGQVFGQSLANVVIFCYQRGDTLPSTFSPRTVAPKFRLPVGSSGAFSLKGLPDGLYRVVAARDDNRNGLLENTEDFVNAPADVSVVNGSAKPLALLLGKAIDRDQPLMARVRALNARLVSVQFSEPVQPVNNWHVALSITSATEPSIPVVAIWPESGSQERILLRLGRDLDTSRYEVHSAPKSVVDLNGVVSPDSVGRSAFRGVTNPDTTTLRIVSITPADSSRSVRVDTTVIVQFSDAVDTSNARMTIWHEAPNGAMPITATWSDATRLVLRPQRARNVKTWYRTSITFDDVRSFTGSELDDSVRIHWISTEERRSEPGSLSGVLVDTFSLAPADASLKLRFLTSGGIVVYTHAVSPGQPFTVAALPAGDYKIDVFADRNDNGIYDHGDHTPFSFSEEWWPTSISVTVRARWAVEGVRIPFGLPPPK